MLYRETYNVYQLSNGPQGSIRAGGKSVGVGGEGHALCASMALSFHLQTIQTYDATTQEFQNLKHFSLKLKQLLQ